MNQLSIDFAQAQRDRGIASSAAHAEQVIDGWSNLALEYVRLFAMRNSGTFTAEDVLEAADRDGIIKPPTDRAYGAVFRRAARLGIIARAGTGVCRKRHMSICVAWRSLVYCGAA